ncbi:Conserved_hypothetical protein [Hexamita inflata]|uniref:Uncharacterized protein n=1 Tax=Hexamita inflata TaxID=28002 RepID=A0AA86S0I0_9EUKA|nr:Conserved hypothetical protein [Hexamita inflata]
MNQSRSKSKPTFNKEQVLDLFATQLSILDNQPREVYLSNLQFLDEKIKEYKNKLPWNEIALQLQADRWKLYHWYFETFERSISGTMDKEDLQILRQWLAQAIAEDRPLDKTFQNQLKSHLSREYHRSTFSIAFNNAKRQQMRGTKQSGLLFEESGRDSTPVGIKPSASMVSECSEQSQISELFPRSEFRPVIQKDEFSQKYYSSVNSEYYNPPVQQYQPSYQQQQYSQNMYTANQYEKPKQQNNASNLLLDLLQQCDKPEDRHDFPDFLPLDKFDE